LSSARAVVGAKTNTVKHAKIIAKIFFIFFILANFFRLVNTWQFFVPLYLQ